MVYQARHPVSPEVEDTIYACRRCGAELIRTSSVHQGPKPAGQVKSAEAA
jgi:hypothetical protein